MRRSSCRITRFVLAALVPLFLAAPSALFADNNAYSFQGQYTPPGCGPSFDFTIGAGTKTIDVAASTIPANDIVLKLYHNGLVVATSDVLTSPEAIHYAAAGNPLTNANLDPGAYSAVVCPFNGQANVAVTDYRWIVTVSELPLPPVSPPGSIGNPVTMYPIPSFSAWSARFSAATVVDAQRTEGEPLVKLDADGNIWESGPWGFSTNMSFIHRSTNDGRKFHLVSTIGIRPDEPPGGGDTDVTVDDQGTAYFVDLEGPLTEIGASVSNDNGHTWRKNAAAVQQSVVDRQWLAVDNGASSGAFDNTVFLAFHESAVGTFIYSSRLAGRQRPDRRSLLAELGLLAGPAPGARRGLDLRAAALRQGQAEPLLRLQRGGSRPRHGRPRQRRPADRDRLRELQRPADARRGRRAEPVPGARD
jgi:hypothetical protein